LIAALRQPPARPNVYHTKTRQDAIDYIIIALQTMMRGGELRNLKKSWINFRWRTITLPKEITKTGEPRIIEMTNTVFEILTRRIKDAQQEGETSEYIFFNRREGKSGKNGPSVDLRTVIRAACKRAGIPYGRNNPGGWSLHDLRHTATTMALESGAPIAGVQDMAGHSDRVMTLKYTHGTPASRRETVRALEEYGVRILSSDSSESVSEPPKRVTKKAGK
jgi:integrase